MCSVNIWCLLQLVSVAVAFDAPSALRHAVEKQRLLSDLAVQFDSDEPFDLQSHEYSYHNLLAVLATASQTNSFESLTQECREDIGMILQPKSYPGFVKSALIPMLDSSGKKGPAILKGHFYFAGHFSQCNSVDYTVEGRSRHFRGQYFRMDIDLNLLPNNRNDSCQPNLPFLEGATVYWEVGVCLPASCTSEELKSLFRPESGAAIDNPVCRFTRPGDATPEINAGFYITLSIMGVIFAICLISGVFDFYFSEKLKHHSISKSLPWRLFMACSLYSNVASIFEVSDAGKEGQISSIHCIRFFSMVWVLMGHLAGNYVWIVANPGDVLALVTDFTTEALTNGFFSVDSFFFISGALLTFMWFKAFNRQPKETMSIYGWVMFYVHRILRLSPPFYMLVIFYAFVLKQLVRDAPLSMNAIVTTDYCSTSWWVELLYLQNWIDLQTPCLGYSWYLATDLQMFLFTPLLLIPLAIKPFVGFIVAAVVFVISTATNIFLVYHYHWPAAQNGFHPQDPEQTNLENYNMLMYGSPLIRCQIYIMGMLVGWLLQVKKQLKIHPLIYLPCWILCVAIALAALFGLHDQTNGLELSLFWRAMYSSLSRPAWGIGLSAIVLLCHYGYGGPINSFMSWHVWVPLGRLSYCGYLIHVPITQLVLSQTHDEVYFSNFLEFLITRVIPITVCTFFFAIFWSASFELSFGRIEKVLLGGARKTRAVGQKSDDAIPWSSEEHKKETLRL